jgi:mRNA interferase MazF
MLRGEIWLADFAPVRGHEQGGKRPALIVSADPFNRGRSGLVIVLPVTGTDRGIPSHARIDPPEGGLTKVSYILCDQIRTLSRDRLERRTGAATATTMKEVEDRLRLLLEL